MAYICLYAGWPISTSHSTVGAVIGYGIFSGTLNWQNLNKIFLSWIASPIIGFVLSYLIVKPLSKLEKNVLPESSKYWLYLLMLSALVQEFWQGANNVGNATSFLSVSVDYPAISRVFGGIFLAVGLLTLGRRVLLVAGQRITRLSITAAFGTQIIIVMLNIVGTMYGLPLSGTHISVASLIGAGLATKSKIDYKICRKVILYWLITLPSAALISIFFAYIPSIVQSLITFIGYS